MNISEKFWNSSIDDIKRGYIYEKDLDSFVCLICGKSYEKGIIYSDSGVFYEAEKAVKRHIVREHISMFDYLININKRYTGLTDTQKELLVYFKQQLSDKEIAKKVGGSASTIRNHRFKFKEREKQSKVFMALMALLEEEKSKMIEPNSNKEELITIHKGATMVDERYAITEEERENIIKNYFKERLGGKLINFPTKEKRKIIVLQHIAENFKPGKRYTEKEVNSIIENIYDDYATIRRYLVEYGFMDRNNDCSAYWIKE